MTRQVQSQASITGSISQADVLRAVHELLKSLGVDSESAGTAFDAPIPASKPFTMSRLCKAYVSYAEDYYFPSSGSSAHESENIDLALRPLCKLFGKTPAAEFGPMKLKRVRDKMIEMGWCRRQINHQVGRIKRMIKWAVENEHLPASVYQSVSAVVGLRIGRTAARESIPVRPVADQLIEPVLSLVSPQVAAMARLQLLTAMRPGEVVIMRTEDIDQTVNPWLYRPSRHKTEHHSHERLVFLGPQAQEVIRKFLCKDDPMQFLFSPAEAEADRLRRAHAARVTPLSCGNRPGTNRKLTPKKHARPSYDTHSYGRAISYACRRAFPVPHGTSAEETMVWKRQHWWHPHQLRHNAATRLRREFGLDVAQVVLGHKTLEITQVYAERDSEAARKAMSKHG